MNRVLITAIGGGGVGDQLLKALNRANSNQYEIYGCDSRPFPAQAMNVTGFTQIPLASDDSYIEHLLNLCIFWKIEVLFLGSEPEIRSVSDNRHLFEEIGVMVPLNSTQLIKLCMNKSQLNKTLSTLGFKVPKHRLISNLNSISDIDFFPVIVKPSGFSSGSKDVFIAQTAKELLGIAQYFGLGSYINDFIVEEYIGTSKNEFTVGVLHDLDGNFIDTIALNRDLTGGLNVRASVSNHTKKEQLGDRLVVSSGISQGVLGKFKLITDQCRAIAEALESRGPLNIQCRVVDGVVHVFEINPRHSGTTSLRAMVGFNEPDLLIRRHLLGQTVEIDQDWPSVRIERTLTEEMILNK